MRDRFRDLLSPLSQPESRTLFGAQMISGLGDWAGRLALAVLVFDRSGSAWWTAAVTLASLLPWLGPGQMLSTFADRFGRTTVMIISDLLRAALILAMLAPLPVPALLGLAFLAGLCVPPFVTARGAALIDVVPTERYGATLALFGVASQAELVLGYALGGAVIALLGPQATLAANASTFVVSALLLTRLRHGRAGERHESAPIGWAGVAAGTAVWRTDPICRRALVLFVGVNMVMVLPEALVVPYADEIGISTSGIGVGVLAATIAVGSMLAITLWPHDETDPIVLLRRAAARALVLSLATAALFATSTTWMLLAAPALLMSGAVDAIAVPTNQVVGQRLPREGRSAAMAVAGGVQYGSQTAAIAIGGAAAVAVGPAWTLAAAATIAAGVTGWSLVRPPVDPR
jgi:MFS family permease